MEDKPISNEFCGFYFEGRTREINCIEDFAAIHSFKVFSEYNYPIFVFSPNPNNLLNNDIRYKNQRVIHIQIPVLDTHEKYSNFMIRTIWDYFPKGFERILFMHPDGFLIKNGYERFLIDNRIDFVGSALCHSPSIDIKVQNKWINLGFPRINMANGGFSYRSRSCCERVSREYSQFILRESGTEEKPPQEDTFYFHIANGIYGGGIVANIKQAMKFSLDPITLEEYNKKISLGFHFPMSINPYQRYRDYYLSL